MTPDKISLFTSAFFTISSYILYCSNKNKTIKTNPIDNWVSLIR